MNLEQLSLKIINELKKSISEERRLRAEGNYPSKMTILGVTAPAEKTILKNVKPDLKKLTPREVVDCAIKLAQSGYLEAHRFGCEMVFQFKKSLKMITAEDLKILMAPIDNWVSTDHLGVAITGPLYRMKLIPQETVEQWCSDQNRWIRRLSLVTTVGMNLKARGGTGAVEDGAQTISICEKHIDDRDDMVVKALSWALRELVKHHPEGVTGFLEKYQDRLPPRVIRETTIKLKTGRKNG